jgi:hypothetical protein
MDLVDNDISVSQLQKNIFSHIHKHMRKFTGANGGNCVYEYTWGESSKAVKKARDPMTHCERFMTAEVMSGIWDKKTIFSNYVSQVLDGCNIFTSRHCAHV